MRVADLTVEELTKLIRTAVHEELFRILDPDQGLEVRPEFEERLQSSPASSERIPFEEVKKRLHLH